MQNSIPIENDWTKSCTGKRLLALIMDYVVYYMIYVAMIIISYVNKFGGVPEVSAEVLYDNVFLNTIQTPGFSLTFLGVVLIWEIVVPLITNGQSISKKILKLKINSKYNKKVNLIFRGIIKIIILNPYGLIAYLIGSCINRSYINIISNILSIVFIVSVIMFFKNKESLHDKIAKTFVGLSK